jgi:hypothetical protein
MQQDNQISISKLSAAISVRPTFNPSFLESISSLNEISSSLSVGITNSKFFTSYQGVITAQSKTFQDSLILGESLRLEAKKINSFIETAIAPMSSAIAGIGLLTVNTNKLYEIGSISKSAFGNVQKISNIFLDVVQGQQSFLTSTLQSAQDIGTFKAISNPMVSNQLISSGINTVLRSLPTYPSEIELPNLEKIYEIAEITKEELSDHQKKLDKMLLKIDPELVVYRKSCWETFRKKRGDYIGQSSSSMRRLVDNLLRTLAPTEKVVETTFFKNVSSAKDSKGNPTRKARIFHIIKFDQNKADHLERLTKGFLEAYDNLSAWDHKPLQQEEFVYGVFITIEGYLFSILSENDL